MRSLVLTLTLASCTSQNPLFGLDTDTTGGTTSASTTTAPASTTEPPPSTSDPSAPGTTSENPTTEALTTDSPSAPVTSTSDPGTSTTGVSPNTTTGGDSTGVGESTGEPACELHKPDGFDRHMYKDDVKAELCGAPITYFGGRLLMGDGPLRFDTSSGCGNDSKLGILSLGKGYDLPLLQDGPCAKLYLYRDGPGPACDIGHFFVVNQGTPLAAGAFTPMGPPANPPLILVSPVEAVLSSACCPADAQDCCAPNFGDYSLQFPLVADPIAPSVRVDNVPGDGGALISILNIQAWDSAICDPNGDSLLQIRDWAAVRTNNP